MKLFSIFLFLFTFEALVLATPTSFQPEKGMEKRSRDLDKIIDNANVKRSMLTSCDPKSGMSCLARRAVKDEGEKPMEDKDWNVMKQLHNGNQHRDLKEQAEEPKWFKEWNIRKHLHNGDYYNNLHNRHHRESLTRHYLPHHPKPHRYIVDDTSTHNGNIGIVYRHHSRHPNSSEPVHRHRHHHSRYHHGLQRSASPATTKAEKAATTDASAGVTADIGTATA